MHKLTKSLFAGIAFAAVAFTAASAAEVQIKVSDLKLSDPAQLQMLNARIDTAANQMCFTNDGGRDLAQLSACKAGVKAEALDKLAQMQGSGAQAKNDRAGALTLAQR